MTSMEAASLQYKPDWAEARKRWVAFWERAATDRPCIDVRAPRRAALPPPPLPSSLQDIWLDAEYVGQKWLHCLETTYYGGEAVPVGGVLLGGYAIGCGPGVRFAEDTIWHPVTMESIDAPLGWWPGPDDPWRGPLTRLLNHLLDLAAGRFLVCTPGQVPCNDLLMLLRGTEEFLADLGENLDKCVQRLEEMFPLWIEQFEYYRGVVAARQPGWVSGYPGLWHPGLIKTTQSDMSCMISAQAFERYVMREMDLLGERYECLWYHLDGPGAIRHLPTLLTRPYIRAIQYVPGDGNEPNGPAYLELYRKVQEAGRCLDIDVPIENVEYLVRHLRPEGLILRTWVATPEDADDLLERVRRWCGTHVHR